MFLVASTQLYKRVCLSIRPLVRRSVMLSLGGQRLDSEQRMVVYTNLFMTFLHFSRGLGSVPESLSIRNLVTTLACVSVCLSVCLSAWLPACLPAAFGAVLQASLFGMAGLLPASYTTPIMSGQGLAGSFAAFAMICAIASMIINSFITY